MTKLLTEPRRQLAAGLIAVVAAAALLGLALTTVTQPGYPQAPAPQTPVGVQT